MPRPLRSIPQALNLRCLLYLLSALVPALSAHAQQYTSIVVFGDSLSDTGNVAHLTQVKYGVRVPGPIADYTDGRFTNGDDTLPAAQKYFGVWVEQLAAMLPSRPIIANSLDGGTNYSYGYALTSRGTEVLPLTTQVTVDVDNMGRQISGYLATHPVISDRTLFVLWGGANDLLTATSAEDVLKAAGNQTRNIQRLIDAGAKEFLILNLPPLGSIPRLNGAGSEAEIATAESELFNQLLDAGICVLRDLDSYRHPHLMQLDVFRLFSAIAASPATFGLVNVTASAQGKLTADPDTYLFWDGLHPTTRGHNILATSAATVLTAESKAASGEEEK